MEKNKRKKNKMSLDKKTKNYISITLYQSKICRNSENYLPYTLSIKYNEQLPLETEKITKTSIIFHEETFHFNISSKSIINQTIEISAFTKKLFVIKNYFGKVIIPFNILNKKNEKQWYFLKDNNDEIILKILLSIDCKISLHQNNSMNQINKSYKIESAYDLFNKKNLNLSLNLNPSSQRQSENKSMINLNSFSIFKNLTNQNQLISITENENSSITISNTDSYYNDCNEINCGDEDIYDNINNISIFDINKAISNKADKILEKQQNLENIVKEIKERDESIGRKNKILKKENDKLENNIKKLEKNKKKSETKNINLCEKLVKFEKELYRNELIKEIININNQIFYNLNSTFIMNKTDLTFNNYKNNGLENYIKKYSKNHTNNNHPNISINVDFIDKPIINSKKLKYEYLTSKHLNSTNFTSIYSNESIINKHNSPSTKNIYESKIIEKNNKNSLDLEIPLNNYSKKYHFKKESDIDNPNLIKIKTTNNVIKKKDKGKRQILRASIKCPSLNNLSKSNVNIITNSKNKKKVFETQVISHNYNQEKIINFKANFDSIKTKVNDKLVKK